MSSNANNTFNCAYVFDNALKQLYGYLEKLLAW